MRNTSYIFRSILIAVIFILLIVMTSCSMYPSIESHYPISVSSGSILNVIHNDLQQQQLSTENVEDLNSTAGVKDTEEVHFADMDQIETTSPVKQDEQQEGIEQDETANKDEHDMIEGVKQEGEPSMKKIAITFDDGPDQKYTPMILDILQENNVSATFYVVGMQIKKYPEVLKRIEAEGHLIGNHSYYHPNFTKLSYKELKKEIDDTDEQIFAVLGHVPTTVRPPYGALNDEVKQQLEEMGKDVVLWNIDPRDWDGATVNDMFDNITENARDGGNILLHSFGSKHVANTVKLLPLIIDELRSQGYQFVTVDELIE